MKSQSFKNLFGISLAIVTISGTNALAQHSRRPLPAPVPIPDVGGRDLNGRDIIYSADEFIRSADRATPTRLRAGVIGRDERDLYASAYAYGMSAQRLGTELEVCRTVRRCSSSLRVQDLLRELRRGTSDFEPRAARIPRSVAVTRMNDQARSLRRQISDIEIMIDDFNRPLPPPPPPRPLPPPIPRGPQVSTSGNMRVQARFDHAYYLNIHGGEVSWNHAVGKKEIYEVGTQFLSDTMMPLDRDVEARIRVQRNPQLRNDEQAQVSDGTRSVENEWIPVTSFNRNTMSVMVVEPAGGSQLVVLEIEWRPRR